MLVQSVVGKNDKLLIVHFFVTLVTTVKFVVDKSQNCYSSIRDMLS